METKKRLYYLQGIISNVDELGFLLQEVGHRVLILLNTVKYVVQISFFIVLQGYILSPFCLNHVGTVEGSNL